MLRRAKLMLRVGAVFESAARLQDHGRAAGAADADGYLYIVDRLKELIKYSAYQVPPAELEAVLVAHPAVADAAVIPSPDEEHGEVPKAFVVKNSEVSAEQLMAYVAERVAPYKKIRLLEFVDQIPKRSRRREQFCGTCWWRKSARRRAASKAGAAPSHTRRDQYVAAYAALIAFSSGSAP